MIDELLRARGLRTGRFTSPHLESMTERISLDGEPLSEEAFVQAYADVAPYLDLVDADQPHPLSFFETVVAMAFAAFADAPVDVAVVEVGMGGSWDATNVADGDGGGGDARSPSTTPATSGTAPATIAVEKAGIIKPGAHGRSSPPRTRRSWPCSPSGPGRSAPTLLREGVDFGVVAPAPRRSAARWSTCRGCAALRRGVPAALRRPPGAERRGRPGRGRGARRRRPAGRRRGARGLRRGHVARAGWRSSGAARRSCSTPPTTRTARRPLVEAVRDSFTFDPLVGVVAVMGDKDVEGLLGELEPVLVADRVHPQLDRPRHARRGAGRDRARPLRRAPGRSCTTGSTTPSRRRSPSPRPAARCGESIGSGGVLVTGSVVTVGEARTLLRRASAGPATGRGRR